MREDAPAVGNSAERRGFLRLSSVIRDLVFRVGTQEPGPVAVTRELLDLAREASCGGCAPCRLGTTRMLELVDNVLRGRCAAGCDDLLAQLADAAGMVGASSRCHLGRVIGRLVARSVEHHRFEYEAYARGERLGIGGANARAGTTAV